MNKHLTAAASLTKLLDNQFNIFGIKIGLDPLIGLIPGIGDFISVLLSFYMVWIAVQMKLPTDKIGKMIQNIVVDFAVGFIPVLGDFVDVFYKANTKNLEILRAHTSPHIIEGEIVG